MSVFQAKIDRLDAILDQRLKREEAELARADAVIEDARRQRQRAHVEERRLIAQAYDDAYRSFGVATPEAADDERPSSYRARLFNRLVRRLPSGHDLADVRADDLGSQPVVFDNFEREMIKAAITEGERPSAANLPSDGSLICRNRVDSATGERSVEWFGTESYIKGMGRPGRRVEKIVDRRSGLPIWSAAR